jgi:hypothetical protein
MALVKVSITKKLPAVEGKYPEVVTLLEQDVEEFKLDLKKIICAINKIEMKEGE